MQDFPDEIISEIIEHLDFAAVNPFARAHPKFARLVKAAAGDIAYESAYYNFESECKDKNDQIVNIYRTTLPNGVPHGRVEFRRNRQTIFRLTYSFGGPTFWRVLADACAVWGHVDSPYYVCTCDDDDFSDAIVRVDLAIRGEKIGPADTDSISIYYDKRGKSTLCDGKNHDMRIPGMIPPASFVVDSDINLAEIEKWGNRVLHHARAMWPNVEPVNRRTSTFDDEPEILEAIFKYCPGMGLPESLIRRPKT